jgi:putative tryptophan/tyrosine transport system substrate-binding protein
MREVTPNHAMGETCWRRQHGPWWWRYLALVVYLAGLGLLPGGVEAADRIRPIRIGVLTQSWGPTPHVVGFRDGLLELGYREDKDFVLGIRFTQGDIPALAVAARELVQYGVDMIFAAGDNEAKAAKQATSRIPIVFVSSSSPVELGLIESFARPGGNLTGVTDLNIELAPKRLQVFHELVPTLKRVLLLYDAHEPGSVAVANAYRAAAGQLAIVLIEHAVQTQDEARDILARLRQGEVGGILVPISLSMNIPGLLFEIAAKQAIPIITEGEFYTERGGLASYGPNFYQTGRQTARLVDKILKGESPSNIPVEVNPQITFTINLNVAKTLGLTIPPQMLFQADRIIR